MEHTPTEPTGDDKILDRVIQSLMALGMFCIVIFALTACNTIAGMGEDVEATGDAIEDTARDAQN